MEFSELDSYDSGALTLMIFHPSPTPAPIEDNSDD